MTELAPRPRHRALSTLAVEQLADAMPQLVWIARADGAVEYYNDRVRAYAGARLEDGLWQWEPMVHADDLPGTERAWATSVETRTPYEYEHRVRMADGEYRWHLSRALPVHDEPVGAIRWYGTATDIHELRAAQDAVVRTQASLGLAMRGGRMGWWSRHIATNAVTWSEELEAIVGLEPGGFPGRESDFLDLVHPDDRPAVVAAVESAIEHGTDYVVEFRYRHADGSWRWMEGRGLAAYDGGRPGWLFGMGMDITERKQADELRDLFLGMLSHELRTPVTAIYGGAQLLRRESLDDDTRREITADVVTEAERLERLVENLLVLARAERNADLGGRDPVMLRPIVARVIESERRTRPGAVVRVDVSAGILPAMGDEPSAELCLRNLVSNAFKYGPPEGPVDVVVRQLERTVEVSVLDRGPGIADDDIDRVFELFYRSSRARLAAAGAGVGLYVVRALVEATGGRVWARNRDGGGAELGFSLPVFDELLAPA